MSEIDSDETLVQVISDSMPRIRDIVRGYAPTHPSIEYIGIYLATDPAIASTIAYGLMQELVSLPWEPPYQKVLDILSLFIDRDDVHDVIDLLGSRSPIPLAYTLHSNYDLTYLLANKVSMEFILHYMGDGDAVVTLSNLGKILDYPPTLTRERVYYMAIQSYIDNRPDTEGTTEIGLLLDMDGDGADLRYRRVMELFPNSLATFPLDRCHNDMGLTDSMDEVPPILRYRIQEGNITTYCLSSSDTYGMIQARATRNPYTGTHMNTDDMMAYLDNLQAGGYPIARSTTSDFYEPIDYDPTMFDIVDRVDKMVEALDLEYYAPTMARLEYVLDMSILALQGMPSLIRAYDGDIGGTIVTAYPNLVPIFNRLATMMMANTTVRE